MPQPGAESISPREREVLQAVMSGATNAEIAAALYLSVRTVESHVSSLLRKVGATDRRELARRAPELTAADQWQAGTLLGVPHQRTSFVGRTTEADTAVRLLTESPVTSLLGPGGMGKTRLAAAVAEAAGPSFPDGGVFVDLVPARPGYVVESVAAALRIGQAPQQPLLDAVADRLRGRTLLVLDNCEHVIDEVTEMLGHLLAAVPTVSVLTTSRERLGVPGETVLHLGPLRTDDEAVALFTDRARAVDPAFQADKEDLAELCGRLDRSPLQIELAAARSASLGVAGLRAGLDDLLRLLSRGRGRDRRHESLRSVIDWSYQLLDDEERTVFARVSLFHASFDLNAAAAVNPDLDHSALADLLGALTDKSLLRRHSAPGAPRWYLLHGVRQFANTRLRDSGESDRITGHYVRWAADRVRELVDLPGASWHEFHQIADDLRACTLLSVEESGTERHERIANLARLMYAHGFVTEALGHFRAAVAVAPGGDLAAHNLVQAGLCAHLVGNARDRYDLLIEAAESGADDETRAICLATAVTVAERFRGSGFADSITRADLRRTLAEARHLAAGSLRASANVAVASAWTSGSTSQSVTPDAADAAVRAARDLGEPELLGAALDAVSTAAALQGDTGSAYRITTQRLELVTTMDRTDPAAAVETIDALHGASSYAIATGALSDAIAIGKRAKADPAMAKSSHWAASGLIVALALTGAFRETIGMAEQWWQDTAQQRHPRKATLGVPLLAAALASGLRGDHADMARWLTRAADIAGVTSLSASPNLAPLDAFVRARVAMHTGHGDLAALLRDAGADFVPGRFDGYAAAIAGEIAVLLRTSDVDHYLDRARKHAKHNAWVAASVTRATGRQRADDGMLKEAVDAWARIGADFERACTLLLRPEAEPEATAELDTLGVPHPAL